MPPRIMNVIDRLRQDVAASLALSNNNLNHYLITAWAKWYSSIPRGTGLSSVALPLTLRLKL